MKVHIGKYINWIGPYQIAEAVLFPLTWFNPNRPSKLEQALSETQDPHDELCHKFGAWLATRKDGSDTYLTKFCQWIQKNKKRKVKIHIDPWDTWSMDNTLSPIILPMLKQLKATTHGSQIVDLEDVPVELRGTSTEEYDNQLTLDFYKTEEELHPNLHDRWNWVLDEMIWTFEQLNDDDNDAQFHSGESEILWQALDKDHNPLGEPEDIKSRTKHEGVIGYQMVKGPNDTSCYDVEAHNKHDGRIRQGLILFGKYFRGLWD
jgi:hypothetical protein